MTTQIPTLGALVRATRQVVIDLINRSRLSLTLVTFVSGGIDDLVEALDEARKDRKVKVRLIVETKEDSKDGEGPEAATAFKNTRKAVPVYRWPKANRGPHGGTMHVKAVVQDRQTLLLSSANLTGAAFDQTWNWGCWSREGVSLSASIVTSTNSSMPATSSD